MVSRAVSRAEVYWVNLDPTIGSEIKKTRPALVVSPDDMNAVLPRVIIAPITSAGQPLGCDLMKSSFKANTREFCWIRCAAWTRSGWVKKWERLMKKSGMAFCWKCWPDPEEKAGFKGDASL